MDLEAVPRYDLIEGAWAFVIELRFIVYAGLGRGMLARRSWGRG